MKMKTYSCSLPIAATWSLFATSNWPCDRVKGCCTNSIPCTNSIRQLARMMALTCSPHCNAHTCLLIHTIHCCSWHELGRGKRWSSDVACHSIHKAASPQRNVANHACLRIATSQGSQLSSSSQQYLRKIKPRMWVYGCGCVLGAACWYQGWWAAWLLCELA